MFAVRLQLEPYAARLAASERSGAELKRLGALAKALPGQIDDAGAFADTDVEIPRTIAVASRNTVLADLLDRLGELTQLSRAITSPSEDLRRATLRDLRCLVRAVRSRDAEGARDGDAGAHRIRARSCGDARVSGPPYPPGLPGGRSVNGSSSKPHHTPRRTRPAILVGHLSRAPGEVPGDHEGTGVDRPAAPPGGLPPPLPAATPPAG